MGCGPQEEFRACSDIKISSGNKKNPWAGNLKPPRPSRKRKPRPVQNSWSWSSWDTKQSDSNPRETIQKKSLPGSFWKTFLKPSGSGYNYSSQGSNGYSYFWAGLGKKKSAQIANKASFKMQQNKDIIAHEEKKANDTEEVQPISLVGYFSPAYHTKAQLVVQNIISSITKFIYSLFAKF